MTATDPAPPAPAPAPQPSTKPDETPRPQGGISSEQQEDEEELHKEEERRKDTASAAALTLEIVGDLPHADVKPPENILFVCKLNPVTRSDDLELIFSRFGKICSCEVIRDKKVRCPLTQTGDSLQYAFIEFEEREAAERAYTKMQNVLIDDRRIWVDFSQSVSKLHSVWVKQRTGGRAPGPSRSARPRSPSSPSHAHLRDINSDRRPAAMPYPGMHTENVLVDLDALDDGKVRRADRCTPQHNDRWYGHGRRRYDDRQKNDDRQRYDDHRYSGSRRRSDHRHRRRGSDYGRQDRDSPPEGRARYHERLSHNEARYKGDRDARPPHDDRHRSDRRAYAPSDRTDRSEDRLSDRRGTYVSLQRSRSRSP